MGDISIIEFGVYGFIAYGSFLMLIISTVKEIPDGKSHSLSRVMYLIPGLICALVLSGSGVDIMLGTETTTENQILLHPVTGNEVPVANTTTHTEKITLIEPIWILVHTMLFLILMIHVIINILAMLTKLK
tara:strand:+ start:776 stop:1168 length:393 start_codon:yes stop_codon:yes gene_type:complete